MQRLGQQHGARVGGLRLGGGPLEQRGGLAHRATAHRDGRAELERTRRQLRREGGGHQLVQQCDRPRPEAGGPRVLGGRDQPDGQVVGARAEPRGPLVRRRRDRIGRPGCRAGRGTVQHPGDGGVGCPQRLREVPGAAVDVVGRQGVGHRRVHGPALLRRAVAVHRGAQQGVPERDFAAHHVGQPRVLGGGEPGDVQAHRRTHRTRQPQVAVAHDRDEQHRAGALVEQPHATGEGRGERGRERRRDVGPTWQQGGRVLGELGDRERVAAGELVHPREPLVGHGCRGQAVDEAAGGAQVEAGQDQPAETFDEVVGLARATDDEHRDRVGAQPTSGKDERTGRGPVEQVHVVQQYGDGRLFGIPAEQAQGGRADGEPVTRGTLLHRQGRRQRASLGWRDRLEQAQRRAEHREQPGERNLAFGLGAGRSQDPESLEATLGPAQQRGLADARLAGDREHATGTDPRPGDEPIDGLLLALPSDQHAPSLEGHLEIAAVREIRASVGLRDPARCQQRGPGAGIPEPAVGLELEVPEPLPGRR